MKCLIVGNGGREHALGWSLQQDDRVEALFFAPGNAGTAELGTNLDLKATDIEGITAWASENHPDLTVVGPEAPLCAGLVDALEAEGLKAFGPNRKAAQLEGSKVFTKELLERAGIPTAQSHMADNAAAALEVVESFPVPMVIKADGLASGKGVIICQNREEARIAVRGMLEEKRFGDAGNRILIEEFLEGEEASIHAITDGKDLVVLSPSQDHKRIFDGDRGPNTGGMGAYAPTPAVDGPMLESIIQTVFHPLLEAFRQTNIQYRGVLYGGLMLTADGPKVLEFNCRFGDPETQVILPLLDTPLLDILEATVEGNLRSLHFRVKSGAAMTVVMAAPGYPEKPETGGTIEGLKAAASLADTHVFHAGTTSSSPGTVQTCGGRVLAVTGMGSELGEARDRAYQGIGKISFPGAQFRKDIGHRAFHRG